MKQIGLLLLLLFSFSPGFATTDPDSLLKVLDQVIRERSIYHSDRQHRIDSLKKNCLIRPTTLPIMPSTAASMKPIVLSGWTLLSG